MRVCVCRCLDGPFVAELSNGRVLDFATICINIRIMNFFSRVGFNDVAVFAADFHGALVEMDRYLILGKRLNPADASTFYATLTP